MGMLLILLLSILARAEHSALVEKFAPELFQELGPKWRYDIPLAVNFDGDWNPRNNWKNAASAPLIPTLYYKEMATRGRTYLFYFAFYPRDYSWFCLPVICHENDLEGMVVELGENGEPLQTQTQFHNSFRSSGLKKGRPQTRAEWGGHGWLPGRGRGMVLRPGAAREIGDLPPEKGFYRLLPFMEVEAQVEALGIEWGEVNTADGKKRLPQSLGGGALNWTSARFPWAWNFGSWKKGQWYFRP